MHGNAAGDQNLNNSHNSNSSQSERDKKRRDQQLLLEDLEDEAAMLGYEGKDIRQYVEKQLREIRLSDRKTKQILQADEEKAKSQKVAELDLRKKEIELKQAEQALRRSEIDSQQDIEKRKIKQKEEEMQLERDKMKQSAEIAAQKKSHREHEDKLKARPKLPYFDEKCDKMDAYLDRFNRHAESLGWSPTEKPLMLASLLKGRALVYYHEMSMQDANDFDKLSNHLLKRFECTGESYRVQLRSARPQEAESMTTFHARVSRYLHRWVELEGVDKQFDKLIDLLLREQILASFAAPLTTFLRENKYASSEAMIESAERWKLAHPRQQTAASGGSVLTGAFSYPKGNGQSRKDWKNGQRDGQKGGHSKNDASNAFSKSSENRGEDNTRGDGNSQDLKSRKGFRCYSCGEEGHTKRFCEKRKAKQPSNNGPKIGNSAITGASAAGPIPSRLDTCQGTVNGYEATILLDSGSELAGVRRDLVMTDQFVDQTERCKQFMGDEKDCQMARVHLDCDYFSGETLAVVIDNPACDFILGKIDGAQFKVVKTTGAVQTRAQKAKNERPFRPLITAKAPQLDIDKEKLQQMQREDQSLAPVFEKVGEKETTDSGGNVTSFQIKDDLLVRRFFSKKRQTITFQVVVPTQLRNSVCIAAHDSLFGGHQAGNSTFLRISPFFFWPGYRRDIKEYCRSCEICQKTAPKGRMPPAPFEKTPVIDVPFSRICIDLVGPVTPVSQAGNRYILVAVDMATRFPLAKPLKNVTAQAVADALIEFFSYTGIPDELLCDNGSQFTADLIREMLRLLSVSQLHSTPYHPETNGVVERMNGSLKSMLRKLMAEKPSDWDRYLPGALFAYREIPQSSTGYAPFELLYGRVVKGPTQLLHHAWTGSGFDDGQQIASEYVQNLKGSLEDMVRKAQDSVQSASGKSRERQHAKAKLRTLKEGSKVLVLLPLEHAKMLLRWRGPFTVIKKVRQNDYLIEMDKGTRKVFHINLLKEYIERPIAASAILRIDVPDEDVKKVSIQTVPTVSSESIEDVTVSENLSQKQKGEVAKVLKEFSHVLSDKPGLAKSQTHTIRLTCDKPVNVKQYPLPFDKEKQVREEVDKMIALDVIEPSDSAYSSPVVMVKKSDSTNRLCNDFRELNKHTVFDAEPIENPESLFATLRDKKYFTKIDLCKGFWQIPLEEKDRQKTAFKAPQGLFQFKRVPFGLSTAPSSFARLMRKLKLEEVGAISFFDDILVPSDSWSKHMTSLKGVFEKLANEGLTAKPSKVEIGFQTIQFLGHTVGNGTMKPTEGKVSKILSLPQPQTKRQVRSLLGLVGFYRRYVENFAHITAPLVDLTKKGKCNKIKWSQECETAFRTIKSVLSSAPVVLLPNFEKEFIIRADASDEGLGAALLQADDHGDLRPILYASRRLLDREKRYPIVERECLAVVWAVDKFQKYIYDKQFVIETDHRPLTFLRTSRSTNGRLQRWALALQEYTFTLVPISGDSNVEADLLSRLVD